MATQVAYWKGGGLRERMIPTGLAPNERGEYRWIEMQNCRRCGGAGGSRHWPGFTCYECGGACKRPYDEVAVTRERAEKLAAAADRRIAKANKQYFEKVAAADALLLPRLGLSWTQLCELAAYDREEGPAHDIARKVCHGVGKNPATGMVPSEAQWKVLDDLIAWFDGIEARAAAAPEKVVLPAGRQTLTGRFVMMRVQRNDFGSTTKGLFVVDSVDGEAKVWMTAPKEAYEWDRVEQEPRALKVRLEMAVTIEPAQDPGFHYGTRPAKVRVLEEMPNA